MRRLSTVAVVLASLLGCASARPPMAERVGGARVRRAFASPTAYEALLRAEMARAAGDRETALRQLELAELADPSDPELPARRVLVLLDDGRVDDAAALAERLTRAFPDAATAWVALSATQERRGDREGALRAVTRALASDPDDPELRGLAARLAGGTDAQVADAMRTAPDARAADRVLAARLLGTAGARVLAARESRRRRAREALDRGAWSEAEAILAPLVRARPDDVVDREALIEARARGGHADAAVAMVAGLALRGDRVSHARRARLWWLCGRAGRALDEAEQALAARPDDALALRVGAQALAAMGRDGEALAMLARVPLDAGDDDAGETVLGHWSGLPVGELPLRGWAVTVAARASRRRGDGRVDDARARSGRARREALPRVAHGALGRAHGGRARRAARGLVAGAGARGRAGRGDRGDGVGRDRVGQAPARRAARERRARARAGGPARPER
ncbi:MAG: tetratricopeptide repeat protein [Polyangiales bacterium]